MVEEENKCIGITTYAARLLNRYGTRLNTHRAQWRITTDLLKKLFNFDESYEELKNTPLNRLDNIHFLYVVTALLYEAKPGGGEDGDGG
jgi:ABC-type transport system involved in cytochrome bd biosynthesis fused ATPase/permease subunit